MIIFSTVWLLTCLLYPKDRVGNSVIVILKDFSDFFTQTFFYEHIMECNWVLWSSFSYLPRSSMLWFSPIFCIVPFCFCVLCSPIYFVLAISFLPTVCCCICNQGTIKSNPLACYSCPQTIDMFLERVWLRDNWPVGFTYTSSPTHCCMSLLCYYPNCLSHHPLSCALCN